MGSRYPAPVEISERANGRAKSVEVALEPIDEITAAAQEMRDGLGTLISHAMDMRERLGGLLAQIESERSRHTVSRLLTTREVAELLQVTPDTVRELKQRGKLRAVQVGEQSPRFRESDVAAFIEARLQ